MSDRITFINHASVLVELGGIAILTDPVYSFSVSYFLPRLKRPGIDFNALPPITLVAISHNHYDHLNFRTLRRVRKNHHSAIVVPRGDGRYPKRIGFDKIHELDWWESFMCEGVTITCVPAHHQTGRTPWNRNKSRASGYVFEYRGKSIYFAGDTAHGDAFTELAYRFPLTVALLPIGAYKPHEWFKKIHLNPATAIEAFQQCGAKVLIPIHWGTFKISDEPMDEPPRLLMHEAEKAGIEAKVKLLQNGESFDI